MVDTGPRSSSFLARPFSSAVSSEWNCRRGWAREWNRRGYVASTRRLRASQVERDRRWIKPYSKHRTDIQQQLQLLHWFTYTETTSRLDLMTQWLTRHPLEGIIQEAVLTTIARPGGLSLNRLRLVVQPGEGRSLAIKPAERPLDHARAPRWLRYRSRAESQSGLSIPLESTTPGPRATTIVLEYEVERKTDKDRSRLMPVLPQVAMPCLSFIWEVITPSGWEPVGLG